MLLVVSPIIYASCFHIKNGKTNVLPFFFQGPLKHVRRVSQLHPFSYGEGIELDPLPPKVLRWRSFDFSWLKLCTLLAFRMCDQLNMHWTATSIISDTQHQCAMTQIVTTSRMCVYSPQVLAWSCAARPSWLSQRARGGDIRPSWSLNPVSGCSATGAPPSCTPNTPGPCTPHSSAMMNTSWPSASCPVWN